MKVFPTKLVVVAFWLLTTLIIPAVAAAQSTDPNFPTPVETNEVNGVIKARDIGDSRITSYFYTFDGGQGDLFINVVTGNFTGDIDVFAAEALRPLAKMVIYPVGGSSQTGRLVYLRKGERLVLRVEGRSPNDDPAMFRIKFGGSFLALTGQKVDEAPTVARSSPDEPGIKVNSVGTIVAIVPKPRPTPKALVPLENETAAANPVKAASESATKVTVTSTLPPASTTPPRTKKADTRKDVATVFGKETVKRPVKSVKATGTSAKIKTTPTAKPPARRSAKPPVAAEVRSPDPLASIHLVVQLKNGDTLERPMSEVVRFSVDKGILTVIGKDGKAERYSILDVSKVTIE
ncbi:MAG: hypothetical protein ABIV21_01585 [Pyrinomonadaceae bacterium]